MTQHHGIIVSEASSGRRPIQDLNTTAIGVVVTGAGANATAFPLNQPVLVTNVYDALSNAGTTGTLPSTLDAIKDHGNPFTVVVRVEEGTTPALTKSNVIGTVTAGGQKTGLQALTSAAAMYGIKPRILAVPGLDDADVTAELVTITERLRAFAYASCFGCETKEAAATYAEAFGSRDLMMIWPDFVTWDTATSTAATAAATARAIGLRAKLDHEVGWHRCLSNVPVGGVTGITKPLFWDLQDPNTDTGYLNARGVTTLINNDGFRFWGLRTRSDDPLFMFESQARTAAIMKDLMAEGVAWAMDKPLHPTLGRDLVEYINARIRSLVNTEKKLIGGECWLDPSKNRAETLGAGKLVLSYRYTALVPLECLEMIQEATNDYFADFAAQVAA